MQYFSILMFLCLHLGVVKFPSSGRRNIYCVCSIFRLELHICLHVNIFISVFWATFSITRSSLISITSSNSHSIGLCFSSPYNYYIFNPCNSQGLRANLVSPSNISKSENGTPGMNLVHCCH